MPVSRSSSRSIVVTPSRPSFETAYAPQPARPAAPEVTLMIAPPCEIAGISAFVHSTVPVRLTAMTASHSSAG